MSETIDDFCIETPRLLLRRPMASDALEMSELAGNWRVARMLSMLPHPYAMSDAAEYIAKAAEGQAPFEGLHRSILECGRFVGVVSITYRERGAELGYWVGEPYWGAGLGSEATAAMVNRYFANPAVESLACGAFADNHASLRIQEKLGFEPVAFGRRHSRARGRDVPHVDTLLTRARYEKQIRR